MRQRQRAREKDAREKIEREKELYNATSDEQQQQQQQQRRRRSNRKMQTLLSLGKPRVFAASDAILSLLDKIATERIHGSRKVELFCRQLAACSDGALVAHDGSRSGNVYANLVNDFMWRRDVKLFVAAWNPIHNQREAYRLLNQLKK